MPTSQDMILSVCLSDPAAVAELCPCAVRAGGADGNQRAAVSRSEPDLLSSERWRSPDRRWRRWC